MTPRPAPHDPTELTKFASGRRALAAAAVLLALGRADAASAQPPSSWTSYAALAKTRLDIGSNIEVSGNYAVIQPGGRLTLGTNTFHSSTPAGSFLAADRMEFTTGASANDVFVNSLVLNGTAEVRGTTTTPFSFPLNVDVPSLPADTANPCIDSASSVTVTVAQSPKTLAPGCYRDVSVDNGAILELSGGNYIVRRIRIEVEGQVTAAAPTTINVRETVTTQLRTSLFPQSGSPEDLQLFVAGDNNQIGNDGMFVGRLVAPNDARLEFGVRAIFVGNAYADGINIFGVHQPRTPTPTPTRTPTVTSTPFVPPTPTPTPTRTPPGFTPTPTPTGTPTVTPTPFDPPTPTPTRTPTVTSTPECPSAFSPNNCD
jgi:hypothetical protein